MSNRKRYFLSLIVIVMIVLGGIGGYLYSDYRNSLVSVNRLSSASSTSNIESAIEDSAGDVVTIQENESGNVNNVQSASVENNKKSIDDIKNYQKANPDICAWITIPGTVIDYPIAQHPTDDSYYLKHGAEGLKSSHGCPFIEICDSRTFQDYNTVVYGHNMNDGSMFAGLHKFENSKFLKEHREVTVTTTEHVMTYKIFAAVMYSDAYIPYYFDDTVKADRTSFIKSLSTDIVAKRSIILQDEKVSADDHIITLSTCDKKLRNKRFLVVAVLKQIDGVDVKD